jgi:predicted SprT family Zn-dependent metalloprotease
MSKIQATKETYEEFDLAYGLFNDRLFGGALPGALFTLQRNPRSLGFFSHQTFVNRGGVICDEIAMNPSFFATRPVEDTLSTIAHEMAHQEQAYDPEPPRRSYHDKRWGARMKDIGLHPSHTGQPGGKEVGEKMSHYILPDGRFIQVCKELLTTNFGIVWFDRYPSAVGKEFGYAGNVKVFLPTKPGGTPARKGALDVEALSTAGALDQEFVQNDTGARDESEAVVVPVFSPTPIEAGLDIAGIVREKSNAVGSPRKTDASNRQKYVCACHNNIWGKPGLNVNCVDCGKRFVEREGKFAGS